ncbi:MAG TPA: hypothetical protein VGO09_00170 [Flavisolibacter sp.]|nr:hypothetical protein [Flavisolibacter sp.]
MKSLKFFIVTASFVVLYSSCTKEHIPAKLSGKWQIQEIYNGYADGGDFQWSVVPEQYRDYIEFQQDSVYVVTLSPSSGSLKCFGSYKIINDHLISFKNDCQNSPSELPVDLTNESLNITYRVIEGQIIKKYIRVQ